MQDKAKFMESLVQKTAEFHQNGGEIRKYPATVEEYARALKKIRPDVSEPQMAMLIHHAKAHPEALTMKEIAAAAGQGTFGFANIHYGGLGALMTRALAIPSPKWQVHTLASFDEHPDQRRRRGLIHPPLLEALTALGWLVDTALPADANLKHAKRAKKPSVMGIGAVTSELRKAGFIGGETPEGKANLFRHAALEHPVYVKTTSADAPRMRAPLIVHPGYQDRAGSWLNIAGLEIETEALYHNSGLSEFPTLLNKGRKETQYGIALGFHHEGALKRFLAVLLQSPSNETELETGTPQLSSNVDQQSIEDPVARNDTERDALVKVRLGQGGYRNALLSYWKGCAVTGCLEVSLLRASHIKPWSRANDEERLDPFNGLLLAPHLDVAFDQGLISFGASGELVISPMLSVGDARRLNLNVRQRLSQIEKRHEHYLAWHREWIFQSVKPAQ